ncbi:unnamed protein product, partial [marine sediment metagenome]
MLSSLSKNKTKGWCQELVGTFLVSKKLFDFNSRKEKQIIMKCNIKETYYTIFQSRVSCVLPVSKNQSIVVSRWYLVFSLQV